MPIKYLELPRKQFEYIVETLKQVGYECKDISIATYVAVACRKRINEIQDMVYVVELKE